MTPRERLEAASRGVLPDHRPMLSLVPGARPDGQLPDMTIATTTNEVRRKVAALNVALDETRPVLFAITNPFGLAMHAGHNLTAILRDEPSRGREMLEGFTEETEAAIRRAISAGADGILYVLLGARGAYNTLADYQKWYLPMDRRVLEMMDATPFDVTLAIGGDDLFVDLIAGLPTEFFAWDEPATSFDSAYVRTIREKAQASTDPASEMFLYYERPLVEMFEPSLPEYIPSTAV